MKNRILALLLAVAMVASMIVLPAYAQDTQPSASVGYCQHCKEQIPEDKWLPWDPTNTGPRTGHYYLAEDIASQPKQITINLDDDLLRNEICLDLRGRTYTVTGLRPFLIYGIFSIMDSVGGGEIAVTGASNAHGAFCQMGKSSNSKDGSGVLNVYSGTLRRINDDKYLVSYGGLIYAAAGATVNLYDGKLIGGDVVPHLISKTNYAPLGGTIYSYGANVNIYGGTVTGGTAHTGTLAVVGSDTETKKYEGYGGNIYAVSGSTVNISGGVIENGYSDVYAGNLYAHTTDVNITGGVIRGGATNGASGNIQFGGDAKLTISGGYITGGAVRTRGANLFINDSKVNIEIAGGTMDGDLSIGLFKSFKLAGAPKILMGSSNGLRLQTDNSYQIDIAGLTEGAEIYLDGVDQVFTDVLEDAQSYLPYFKDAVRADISVDETGALKVAQGTTGFCPHCWESGEQATWTEFDNSTPATNVTIEGAHHVYLTEATARTRLLSINAGADYAIDTAGKTLTTTGYKFANLYGKLSIMDSVGGGMITGTGHNGANGGVIMGGATAEFHMYSGTLSRTVKSGEEAKRIYDGGILYAPAGSQVYIHGGIIRSGRATIPYKNAPKAASGGNIFAAGSFTMTGGVLLGGQAHSYMGYVTGTTAAPTDTDTLYVGCGGNLYLSGAASISGGHVIGGSAGYGGNIYASNLQITGGVIREGVTNDALATGEWGGNIYYTGQTDARIQNAIIRNGTTDYYGGNIGLYKTTLTVTDALISDGCAGVTETDGRGGNIYLNGTSQLYIQGATLSSGYAYNVGGNIFGPSGSVTQLHSGLLMGGVAEIGSGGSVYASSFTMTGGRVVGGTTKAGVGGNIAIFGGSENFLTVTATENMPAPVIANGTSGKLGGNINLAVSATGTLTGAQIFGGTGDTKNSNSSFNADNIFANEKSVLTMTDCTVSGIIAESTSGNGVYCGGELILKGATSITNEEKKSCSYISSVGKLTVDAGFIGETSVAFENSHFADVNEPQGGVLAEKNSAGGVFTGKLLLEGYSGRDYGLPAIFAEAGDSKLYVASTAVVDPALDTVVWYRDVGVAAAAVTPSSYLKLFKSENALAMQDDLVVDLNGKNLTVTGEGTLYGFDSKNDDYTAFGTLTTSDVEVAPVHMAPNGKRYVAISDETGTSFHRLGIAITGVALRPADAGIYYKATWECDDVLKAKIDSFGIAVSTENMPKADFASDADTLYTAMAAEEFVSGQAVTSAMITDIVKTGEDNQTRGTMPIYAAPYAVIDGMTIVADDNAPTMGGVIYSMKTVLQSINRVWPKLTETQQQGIRELYAIDADVFDTWDLYNITAAINGTASIRPLKVLTLGHSLAVDSGHMLNLVADAEGYDQPMEIATLYYSGCPLYKHVNYIKQNAGVYQLYVSSTTTPDKPPVIIKGVTMEYGLKYADWDIIIMQGGVFEIGHDATYTDGKIQFIQNYVNQNKTNPNAVFGWNMPWACPTDNSLRDQYPYSPNTYYTSYEAFNDDRTTFYNAITGCVNNYIVTDDSFIYLIPSGTAIENALSSYLVESDLHRDYVHVTDLGRVISSYTWYCTLAGIDRLDEIKLDAIPKAFLKSTADKTVDYVLTDMEKAIILESVNNALADPLRMTQSQYTEAPAQ